jgi:hypothetical protein
LGSSLSTLDGTYTLNAYFNGAAQTGSLTFSGGTITGDDAVCTYTGTASIIDSRYNAYAIALNRKCLGKSASLTGLASYYPATLTRNNLIDMIVDDGGTDGVASEIVATQ